MEIGKTVLDVAGIADKMGYIDPSGKHITQWINLDPPQSQIEAGGDDDDDDGEGLFVLFCVFTTITSNKTTVCPPPLPKKNSIAETVADDDDESQSIGSSPMRYFNPFISLGVAMLRKKKAPTKLTLF